MSPRAEESPGLVVGKCARDTKRDRVGEVMDVSGSRVWLRPVGGGREWEAERAAVEPLTPREALSVKVAEANAAHRWEAR
ncbi:hypothetical protein [Streptomyces sp. NPDC003077]|uniref:hypothetical protein n=1 Tax=Streptomyces sp. NPDC003077 TaxID=3154443 RepID=UPI0033B79032